MGSSRSLKSCSRTVTKFVTNVSCDVITTRNASVNSYTTYLQASVDYFEVTSFIPSGKSRKMGGTNLSKIGNNRVHPVDSDEDVPVVAKPKPKPKTAWSDNKADLATKIKQTLHRCLPKLSKSNKVGPAAPCESDVDMANRFLNLVPVEDTEEDHSSTSKIAVDGESKEFEATPNQPENVDVAVPPPQQPSRKQKRQERLLKKITEMGYLLDPVPRDGDNPFEAAARQLGRAEPSIVTDAQQLRHFLVRYIRAHAARYSAGVEGGPSEFHRELDDLARPGHWSMELADTVALPIVLAEYFRREVHLITCRGILVVTPELSPKDKLSGSPVIMVYDGIRHYDGIRLPARAGYR
ncbi:structural constituent of ribosome [Branchiostoma belcheri]|nr:structural constituent of ribosome [Branchiostoma belcheri]